MTNVTKLKKIGIMRMTLIKGNDTSRKNGCRPCAGGRYDIYSILIEYLVNKNGAYMVPKTQEQYRQIKDEMREKIYSGALRVFSHRGYAATRISDIAKACGISHGLLYHYFSSKDEIFTDLVFNAATSSANALLHTEKIEAPAIQKIEWITTELLRYIGSDSDSAYYFFLMIQVSVTESLPEPVIEAMKKASTPNEVMGRMIAEGQQQGDIVEGDIEALTNAYWAAINGLAIFSIAYAGNMVIPDPAIILRILKKEK
jgi:AcrR family transcriptional regulator